MLLRRLLRVLGHCYIPTEAATQLSNPLVWLTRYWSLMRMKLTDKKRKSCLLSLKSEAVRKNEAQSNSARYARQIIMRWGQFRQMVHWVSSRLKAPVYAGHRTSHCCQSHFQQMTDTCTEFKHWHIVVGHKCDIFLISIVTMDKSFSRKESRWKNPNTKEVEK